MPRGSIGRRVARAAATGGNRSYRGRAPVGWYAMMGLISVVGLGLIGYSRYEVQHPAVTTTTTTTTLPSAWYAAVAFDVCGKVSTLPVSSNTKASIISTGNGILTWSPRTVHSPTLQQFVASYQPKLVLTSTSLQLPGKHEKVWHDGDLCGSKPGTLQIEIWKSVSVPNGQPVTGGPGSVKLANGQMVTVAFVPSGTAVQRPPKATQEQLLIDFEASQQPTTSSTVPVTVPPTTTTVKGGTTTTVKGGTTTTVKGGTTTTVAGGSTTTVPTTSTSASTTTSTPGGATTTTAPAH